MDRILIILKKENGPRASSAPALGLNTIIFKHVYWYMQQTQVSVYRTIGPLVLSVQQRHQSQCPLGYSDDEFIFFLSKVRVHGMISFRRNSFLIDFVINKTSTRSKIVLFLDHQELKNQAI